jgi:hypothetical protein
LDEVIPTQLDPTDDRRDERRRVAVCVKAKHSNQISNQTRSRRREGSGA